MDCSSQILRIGVFSFQGREVTESNEDHGAELKALAALHGEDVARKCQVISGRREK